MNCKRCGAELENNARFCPTCGALQPMICPACGAESRPGSRECSACGRKLPLAERESKLVYTKRKKHTGAIIGTVIGVLCALLLLGGAVWLLLGSLPGEKAQTEQPEQVQQVPEEPSLPEPAPEDPAPAEPAPENTPSEQPPAEEEPAAEEDPPVEEDPPAEEEPPAEEPPAQSQWIFADSSERLLTDSDIAGLSAWELKVARNEIYARHGRRFTSAELQAYFDGCDWYEGTIAPEKFTDDMLTDTELANVAFLKAAE